MAFGDETGADEGGSMWDADRPLRADEVPAFLRAAAWETLTPTAWRRRLRRSERRAGQQALIEAARTAERGATAEEAALLYRAADAVLPLRGPDLRRYGLTALAALPRPLTLEVVEALLRYARQEGAAGTNGNAGDVAGAISGAVRDALAAAESGIPGAAMRARISALRRSLDSLTAVAPRGGSR